MIRLSFVSATTLMGLAIPITGLAAEPQMRSELRGYEITALTQLPTAPAGKGQNCVTAPPVSTEAEMVASRGWQVVNEADIGPYRAIAFVGSSENGSSGSCAYQDSNLGLFQKGELIGIVWESFEETPSISHVTPLEGQALRVYAGDFVALPVGDLKILPDGTLLLAALPEVEHSCEGAVSFPVAWGSPLSLTRPELLASGWQPKPTKNADPYITGLADAGFPEIEDCSGTGLNYCSFTYQSAGAELRIVTYGEPESTDGAIVAEYQVTCKTS